MNGVLVQSYTRRKCPSSRSTRSLSYCQFSFKLEIRELDIVDVISIVRFYPH